MRKFIVISPEQVCCLDEGGEFCTLDEVPQRLGKYRGPLLFAIVPQTIGRVLGTERTIDTAMPQQYPGANSFSIEALEPNVYQVYVAPDELLQRLRSMGRDVRVVPYPAAVRAALGEQKRPAASLIERTRIFLSGPESENPDAANRPTEQVVVDSLGGDFLVTALRGREILVERYAQGGDPVIEVQRSLAANRMDNPIIFTKDEDLALELKSQGFNAELTDLPGVLVGESAVEQVQALRFMNELEVTQKRAREGRRQAGVIFVVALVIGGLAAAAFSTLRAMQAFAESEGVTLAATKVSQIAQLTTLYQERYASLARQESLQIREELYDLSITLPPQVALLSVQKDATGLSAVMERRPGAAPFSRDDLRSAFAGSPFFANAKISEEYEGHVVRYLFSKPAPPKMAPPP